MADVEYIPVPQHDEAFIPVKTYQTLQRRKDCALIGLNCFTIVLLVIYLSFVFYGATEIRPLVNTVKNHSDAIIADVYDFGYLIHNISAISTDIKYIVPDIERILQIMSDPSILNDIQAIVGDLRVLVRDLKQCSGWIEWMCGKPVNGTDMFKMCKQDPVRIEVVIPKGNTTRRNRSH
jgi:hypothetical protein